MKSRSLTRASETCDRFLALDMGQEEALKPFLEKFRNEKVGHADATEDQCNQSRAKTLSVPVLINIAILFVSFACLISASVLYHRANGLASRFEDSNSLLQSTVNYAPIITTTIPFKTKQIKSYPLSDYNASIYRQPPSPIVDAEWDRLSDIGTHLLSSSQILSLGKDPSKVVKVPESWGYGTDSHLATLDGIHLVHCLNSMRKSLKTNYDYYHPDPVGPEYLPHLTHCVEAVLQHLMCRPSMEFLTQIYIERQKAPFPDFEIEKKCWDYEAILKWKDENRNLEVEERFKEFKPDAGMAIHPLPPLVAETWDIIDGIRKDKSKIGGFN